MRSASRLFAAALAAAVPAAAAAQDAAPPQTRPALTIYQHDLGLVEESRAISLSEGDNRLRMTKVSGLLMPGSVALTLDGQGEAAVREVLFERSVADRQTLLRAFEGSEVTIVRETGESLPVRERARVLRADPPLLEVDGRIVTEIDGRVMFDSLPDHLTLEPALDVVVRSPAAADARVGLRYLTGGLSWHADHVIELGADGAATFRTWAMLENATGVGWSLADVTLAAGEINVTPEPEMHRQAMMEKAAAASVQMDSAQRQAVGGLHFYRLDAPVRLDRDQSKQIALLSSDSVRVETVLRSDGQPGMFFGPVQDLPPTHPQRVLILENSAERGLGEPLPAGTARVYAQDQGGRARFVGEDRLEHTPTGEEARLRLGEAFDVTVDRTQTAFVRVAERVTESAYDVVVRNASDEPVTVEVVEIFPGDWRILEESVPHQRISGAEAQWDVSVPPNGESLIRFRVQTTF